MQSRGGDQNISEIQGLALFAVVALQQAGEFGNGERQRENIQAVQKAFGVLFFPGAQAGEDFGDVDGAAGQGISLFDQITEQLPAASLVVDGVDDDAGVEEQCGHTSGRLLS